MKGLDKVSEEFDDATVKVWRRAFKVFRGAVSAMSKLVRNQEQKHQAPSAKKSRKSGDSKPSELFPKVETIQFVRDAVHPSQGDQGIDAEVGRIGGHEAVKADANIAMAEVLNLVCVKAVLNLVCVKAFSVTNASHRTAIRNAITDKLNVDQDIAFAAPFSASDSSIKDIFGIHTVIWQENMQGAQSPPFGLGSR